MQTSDQRKRAKPWGSQIAEPGRQWGLRMAYLSKTGFGAKYQQKRRGVRLNSRVPVAIEWEGQAGRAYRAEAHTRVVGPYGCLVVLPRDLAVDQHVRLTNLASRRSNPAVVVWRGNERAEGWELGIELIEPEMGFWGIEL